MSYPASGNFDGGPCPASHPVHMLTLFYEVIYETQNFADMWYGDNQPFVFANGDPTGFSIHGDFINGWDVPTLQNAITACAEDVNDCNQNGTVFTFPSLEERGNCKLAPRVDEPVTRILAALPGCNPVSSKSTTPPATAANCPVTPLLTAAAFPFTDFSSSLKWKYLGCGVDNFADWGNRALTGASLNIAGGSLTIEKCVQGCQAAGFTYAGMEYADECYCGNTIDSRALPTAPGFVGNCRMKYTGDASEICGGPAALTIYEACGSGAACVNPDPGYAQSGSLPLSSPSSSGAVKIVANSSSSSSSANTTPIAVLSSTGLHTFTTVFTTVVTSIYLE